MAYGGPSSSGMIVCIYFIILFICGNCILYTGWKHLWLGLCARDINTIPLRGVNDNRQVLSACAESFKWTFPCALFPEEPELVISRPSPASRKQRMFSLFLPWEQGLTLPAVSVPLAVQAGAWSVGQWRSRCSSPALPHCWVQPGMLYRAGTRTQTLRINCWNIPLPCL